ncbi:PHP-associated domain-containing protein [Desulfatiglans anilini]|uniref:PHP-associated domain-containing protein n=1 Tax=Desulfatiglans anilini TaxID=90728 RepID=UPI000409305B|nr:PHP domain-containing protein [Desulfatiglans anilini]
MPDVTFIRNKIVTVEVHNEKTLLARGLLADDIYGLEIKVYIDTTGMTIHALEGQWNRWTTPECHRAIEELHRAVGACILDSDFSQKIKKTVGRLSCRHFANLLLECCDSAREAAELPIKPLEKTAAPASAESPAAHAAAPQPDRRLNPETVEASVASTPAPEHSRPPKTQNAPATLREAGGCILDLHLHSYPASPCSSASVDDLIREAKRIGLDGICLTDHHHRWDRDSLARLSKTHDFLVLGGNEVTTDQGDILVFGAEKDFPGIVTIQELREQAGPEAFLIAAHPFRGFLTFGIGRLGLTPEKAMQRTLFRYVDAVEVLNGKVTEKENAFSRKVADALHLPATGGSDAHEVSEVGLYATHFEAAIQNEAELLAALRSGRFQPVVFRVNPSPA